MPPQFLKKFQIMDQQNNYPFHSDTDLEKSFLTDELDHLILMHRDAHFAGDFGIMLAYYQEDHIGVNPEFDLERIAYLAEVEKHLGQNLASLILSGQEAEKVASARLAYERLKEIYDQEEEKSPFPRLLADLILTEDEEPEAEIEAIVAQGTRIVPELLHILKSDDAYDPLFPGYGYAPYFAILCLGKIKDPSAVIPLFEVLGHDFIFEEEVILASLRKIGDPAKRFLLDVLKGRPLTKDSENAAYALTMFADQEQVALFCLDQLKDPEVLQRPLLRSYLLSNCEELRNTSHQKAVAHLLQRDDLPLDFRQEIENMLRQWD